MDGHSRYARQITLKAVGASGQAALLAQPVTVRGEGLAASTAAAYLAAGGSPVAWAGSVEGQGFLAPDAALGLRELNPELPEAASAGGPPEVAGRAGGAPFAAPDLTLRCAAGTVHARGDLLWWRPGPECAACAAAVPRDAVLGGAGAVQLGTFAALALQRLVLGLEARPGALRLAPDGGADAAPAPACAEHGA